MAEGDEFLWGRSGGISHADLNPIVKVGDCWVAVDARDGSLLDMEFHVLPNEGDLVGVLLPRSWKDEDFRAAPKDKFGSAGFDELCPNRIHPSILGWVILKMEDSALILHEFLILVQGVLQAL
jgi:hypothetical protein